MNSMSRVSKIAPLSAAMALVFFQSAVFAAPPKVVTAPNSDPGCFAPWSANTKLFQYPGKKGRTALHWPMGTLPTHGAFR